MMMRFFFFLLLATACLMPSVVFAQNSSEGDLCLAAAQEQGWGSAGCVQMPDCTPDAGLSILVVQQTVCAQGEVCCVAEGQGGGGGATMLPEEPTSQPQVTPPGQPVTLPDPLGGVTVPAFFGNVIRVFLSIAGAIALLMFVYGGIMWILSGGESSKVQAAQKILVNSTIGIILLFGAYMFTTAIVQSILGGS